MIKFRPREEEMVVTKTVTSNDINGRKTTHVEEGEEVKKNGKTISHVYVQKDLGR